MKKNFGRALVAGLLSLILMVPTFAEGTGTGDTTGTITVSYVNALDGKALTDGNGQPMQDTITAEIGKETTVTAKPTGGYTVWGSTTEKVSLTPSNNNKVVTFKCYKEGDSANLGNVIFYYKNLDTNKQILEPVTLVNVDIFKETNNYEYTIPGYDYNRTDYVIKNVDGVNTLSYALKYTANGDVPAQGTINYECYTSDDLLISESSATCELGEVTVNAPTFENFTVNGSATQKVFLTETSNVRTVKFVYDYTGTTPLETTKTITYKYINEADNSVLQERVVNVNVGTLTQIDKGCPVSGYEIVSTGNAPDKIRFGALSQSVVYEFVCRQVQNPTVPTGVIHVEYVEQGGNLIFDEYLTKELGTYQIDAKVFDGYNLVSASPMTVTLDTSQMQVTITFVYQKTEVNPNPPVNTTGSVTINYVVNGTGDLISTDVKADLPMGSHTFNAIAFDGYTLTGDSSQTVELTEDNKDVTITFYYDKAVIPNPDPTPTPTPDPDPDPKPEPTPTPTPVTGTITIAYKDVDGNSLAPSETYTNVALGNYTYSAKTFKGYTLVGNNTVSFSLTESNTKKSVVFTYKKTQTPGSISIIFVDDATGESLSTSKYYNNLDYGTYTYSATTLGGYTLSGANIQSATISEGSPSAIIIFRYTKDSKPKTTKEKEAEEAARKDNVGVITIKYVDSETGKEIATSSKYEELELKEYTYSAINVDGYILDDSLDKKVTLTKDNPTAELVFKYKQSEDSKNKVLSSSPTNNKTNQATSMNLEPVKTDGLGVNTKIIFGILLALLIFLIVLGIGFIKDRKAEKEELLASEDIDEDEMMDDDDDDYTIDN